MVVKLHAWCVNFFASDSEIYLGLAVDHADLELRLRTIERVREYPRILRFY
jgi:hypothetical protein